MAKKSGSGKLSKIITVFGIMAIVIAIPLTVIMSQKQQQTKQNASCPQKFTDVGCDSPQYAPSSALLACGVVRRFYTSCPLGAPCLQPYTYVTRAEAVAFITRYHLYIRKDWQLISPKTPTFSDVPPSSTFFREVETARYYGFIGGYPDGTFKPYDMWTHRFKGVDRNAYNFGLTSPIITRGDFIKLMYYYSLVNDSPVVGKCASTRVIPAPTSKTVIPTPSSKQ